MQNVEPFSFQCGAIDSLNEMVRVGVKTLALSPALDTAQNRDALLPFTEHLCQKYGTQFYIEDALLITDLFPYSSYREKYLLLIYQHDHILEQYLRLKERKNTLVLSGAYFGGNRNQIAWEFGRLLSYSDDAIRQLIADNTEKEQF